jgi:hypothetical protein
MARPPNWLKMGLIGMSSSGVSSVPTDPYYYFSESSEDQTAGPLPDGGKGEKNIPMKSINF